MNKSLKNLSRNVVAICIGIIIFGACRSAAPPVTFFTLSSIRGTAYSPAQPSIRHDVLIGIGPAQFPDYLDRPQIITRLGSNQLDVSEFNRWGGKLDQDFLNILAENLSLILDSSKVIAFPWKGQIEPDYRIALDIHQFEGQDGGAVLLNVTWAILEKANDTGPLFINRSIISQPVSGQGYGALVSAYSLAVAELSREVSAEIIKIAK
ncbi:MAG: PqiC family protein [Desulfobacterales bacterium]|nr:PqiC family protein [Desulfobacterales bacterium]